MRCTGPPGWSLDAGLTTLPCKKQTVTQSKNVDNDTTQARGAAVGADTTLLDHSLRNKGGWPSWNAAKAAEQSRAGRAANVTALCAFWRGES